MLKFCYKNEFEAELKANGSSYEVGINKNGNAEFRVKTSTIGGLGLEHSTYDIYEITPNGQRLPVRPDVSSSGLEKLSDSQTVDNSNSGQANISILGGLENVAKQVIKRTKQLFNLEETTPVEQAVKAPEEPVVLKEAKVEETKIEVKTGAIETPMTEELALRTAKRQEKAVETTVNDGVSENTVPQTTVKANVASSDIKQDGQSMGETRTNGSKNTKASQTESNAIDQGNTKSTAENPNNFGSRLKNAEASGVKDLNKEEYRYYVHTGPNDGYYSNGTKTVITFNDGTVITDYSSHQKVAMFPDGSFVLEDSNRGYAVIYDPNGKLSITDRHGSHLGFDYTIDVDAKLLQDIGYNPSANSKIANVYDSNDNVAKMYNEASRAVVNNAKAELSNIASRLANDPIFANQPELKQTVTEMLKKLPETEDMVNRDISSNYYQNDIKELRAKMAEVTKFATELELNNTSEFGKKIIQEVKVPYEELRAADRQIISELAGLEQMMEDNPKVFKNRVGFQKDYKKLKDMVIQELNTRGKTQAIERLVNAKITEIRSDFQKMIDAMSN